MKKMTALPLMLLLFACGSGNVSNPFSPIDSNKVEFSVKVGPDEGQEKVLFEEGNYTFDFQEAVVKEGSYSGIELVFHKKESEDIEWKLTFELPAAKTMKVYIGAKGVVGDMPKPPFTVTQDDFTGLMNALYETEQSTYVSLNKTTKTSKNVYDYSTVTFNIFELQISKADFGPQCFSMDCKFKASMTSYDKGVIGREYSINGSFSISSKEYVLSEVD